MSAGQGRRHFESQGVIGRPLDRVDGRRKVTGTATYAAEHQIAGLVHAVLVGSTVPSRRETFAAILARHGLEKVTGDGGVEMARMPHGHRVNAFGAQFVEVQVDPDLGLVRVTRALGVFDIGTVLNPKTARGQGIGGIVFGIGMALLEHTAIHPILGTVVSPDLAGYLLPVHASVPSVEAIFVDVDDPYVTPLAPRELASSAIPGWRRPSLTPCTTPPGGASAIYRSPRTWSCSPTEMLRPGGCPGCLRSADAVD